jgi:hypothetical protein
MPGRLLLGRASGLAGYSGRGFGRLWGPIGRYILSVVYSILRGSAGECRESVVLVRHVAGRSVVIRFQGGPLLFKELQYGVFATVRGTIVIVGPNLDW